MLQLKTLRVSPANGILCKSPQDDEAAEPYEPPSVSLLLSFQSVQVPLFAVRPGDYEKESDFNGGQINEMTNLEEQFRSEAVVADRQAHNNTAENEGETD